MKKFRILILLLCALSLTFDLPAAPSPAATATAQAKKRSSSKKKSSAKKSKKKSSDKAADAQEDEPQKPSAPEKKQRTPVVRGSEVLQLKSKRDGASKLYGYENVGDKYYWWAEAHYLGAGKEQLNLGQETQWVIAPQYTRVAKEFSEGLAAVETDGKVGFIDRQNRFIIPPAFEPYDDLAGFRYGLAAVKSGGKFGFIDKQGNFVIPPVYDDAENFGDDYLAVVKIGKKFGCIDLTGDSVVPCNYIAKEMMKTLPGKNKPYREAKKRAKERWQQGFYNDALKNVNDIASQTDITIANNDYVEPLGPVVPEGATAASDGIFIVTAQNGSMGATDSYGRVIIPCRHSKVNYDATQRIFTIESSLTAPDGFTYHGVGIANTAGGWIIPPLFDSVGSFNAQGEAPVTVEDISGTVNVFGLVDEPFLQRLLEESVKEKGTKFTRRLIGILPTCAPAHNCLGIYYASEQDNLRDAIHHFTVAHNLVPDNEDFKNNMKAAKSTRNNRRWNRVLTGMSIAATVLTVGAVTYSAAKGVPMQSSSFASSPSGFSSSSDTDFSTATSTGTSSHRSSSAVGNGKCKSCNGSGTCRPKSYAKRKFACHGSGLCGHCDGTGWLAAGGDRAPCPQCKHNPKKCANCNGTGRCPDCKGTGKS